MILFHQPTQPIMIYWGETMNVPETIMYLVSCDVKSNFSVEANMLVYICISIGNLVTKRAGL